MHVNRMHVPRYCAYEELRAAGDSEIPGPYRHLKIRCGRCARPSSRGALLCYALCGVRLDTLEVEQPGRADDAQDGEAQRE